MEPVFAKLVGDNGSYGFRYNDLKQIPSRKIVEIKREDVVLRASAGDWREYGVIRRKEDEPTMVYLPVEYFKKYGVQENV